MCNITNMTNVGGKMETESRHEKFKSIAVKRTNDIFERIRILGNWSGLSFFGHH